MNKVFSFEVKEMCFEMFCIIKLMLQNTIKGAETIEKNGLVITRPSMF
jgi:hypothetical protein